MSAPDLEVVRAIEERSFNAWPALETHLVDGWIIRLAGGYTKRANSLNARRPCLPIEAVLERADALFRAQLLPAIVRLSPLAGADADQRLAERGFDRADETIVLSAEITALPSMAAAPNRTLHLDDHPSEAWSAGFAAANGLPAERRQIHDRMLANIAPPAAFATLGSPSGPLAYGLAVVERGWIGLFDIVTLPEARRQGAAAALVQGLLAWGRRHGADRAYLQVTSANAPAIALYRKLGFIEAYRYHYRISQP